MKIADDMNDFFNFKRFCRYAVKVYVDNSRKYMVGILLILCIQAGLVIISAIGHTSHMASLFYIEWMWVVLGVLFVFSEMSPLRSRHTAMINNTLPVSIFEKYIIVILNTMIVFGLVYWAVFFVVSLISSGVFGYGTMDDYWFAYRGAFNAIKFMRHPVIIFMPFAIFAGGCNMRNHLLAFLVVTVVAVPLLGSPTYLPWFISSNFLENMGFATMFNGLSESILYNITRTQYTTTPMFADSFEKLTGKGYELYIWGLLMLVAGYFKLHERQIK